jgi:hypothetical protein
VYRDRVIDASSIYKELDDSKPASRPLGAPENRRRGNRVTVIAITAGFIQKNVTYGNSCVHNRKKNINLLI